MAINTRAKRQSATGMRPFHKAILPDGTIDASDRVHLCWGYSGIAIAEAGEGAFSGQEGFYPYIFQEMMIRYRIPPMEMQTLAGILIGEKTSNQALAGLIKGDKTLIQTLAGYVELGKIREQTLAGTLFRAASFGSRSSSYRALLT